MEHKWIGTRAMALSASVWNEVANDSYTNRTYKCFYCFDSVRVPNSWAESHMRTPYGSRQGVWPRPVTFALRQSSQIYLPTEEEKVNENRYVF